MDIEIYATALKMAGWSSFSFSHHTLSKTDIWLDPFSDDYP